MTWGLAIATQYNFIKIFRIAKYFTTFRFTNIKKLTDICLHTQYSESLGVWTLSIVRYSKIYEHQYFGNWICFRPQVRKEEFLKYVFYILEYQMMEKVQTPSDSECYTPLSEPFKIYIECLTELKLSSVMKARRHNLMC
jgi:hypothetical protein